MKKAGSSNSKSRTRPTSKSSSRANKSAAAAGASTVATPDASLPEFSEDLADLMSVGHRPVQAMAPQDETLFRAFQSNLLSLISHELRTPLMGILNSLTMLEDPEGSGVPPAELIKMARKNAQRLHQTLAALLDLAALESGTFHARLREVNLSKIVHSKVSGFESMLRDRELKLRTEGIDPKDPASSTPVLADPQKLGRAVELCLAIVVPRAEAGTEIVLRIFESRLELSFRLTSGMEKFWDTAWFQALAGYEGGVVSPSSAFGGVLQSEQAFLSRMEEGLGSEFLLVHEIMRRHQGKFTETRDKQGQWITLSLELPTLASEDGLQAVLASRAYNSSTELSAVALALIEVPKEVKNPEEFREQLQKSLFRSSDAVYSLTKKRQIALVMDDCKPGDGLPMLKRLEKTLGHTLRFGLAHCPEDSLDPRLLYKLASERLTTGRYSR